MSGERDELRFLDVNELWLVSGESFDVLHRVGSRFGSVRTTLFWDQGRDSFHLLGRHDYAVLSTFADDPGVVRRYLAGLEAETVVHGVTPDQPAVVVDGAGAILGAWIENPPTVDVFEAPAYADLRMVRSIDLGLSLPGGDVPAPRGEEGEGEPVIRRTPHLDAPDSLPTKPGELIEVLVRTDTRRFREAEEGADVVIEAPPEVTEIDLEVTLSVSDHFAIEGEATQFLTIRRHENDSNPVTYRLRVVDKPPERKAGICALFTYRRRSCGHVTRAWRWSNSRPLAEVAPAHTAMPASLPVHVDSDPPDLAVFVTAPVNDSTHFKCAVQTTLVPGYEKPTPRKFGLSEKVPDLIERKLQRVCDDSLDAADRRDALQEAGYAFWEVAPPVFKEVIWKLIDTGKRPRSIYIASAEPSLPWELMIPTRHDHREPDELRPLGVEFAIGRWARSDAASPPQRIPIRNSFVIAPEYEEEDELEAADEVGFVRDRLRGTRIEEATKRGLDSHFGEHHASLLHFACHGADEFENDEAVYLDDVDPVPSESLRPLRGFKALCRGRAPLVFVNACNAGCLRPALAGGAGFPRVFGDLGARAVLAPLWPVKDELAARVATTVYGEALKPGAEPVAEILRSIRECAYEEGDLDTYAAYTFFGDPRARIELVDE